MNVGHEQEGTMLRAAAVMLKTASDIHAALRGERELPEADMVRVAVQAYSGALMVAKETGNGKREERKAVAA